MKQKKKKINYKQRTQLREQKLTSAVTVTAAAFFIVIAAVYPAFIGLSKYLNLTHDKTVFFWITVAAAFAALFFITLVAKRTFYGRDYYTENEPPRYLTVAEWALIGFLFWGFISAVAASWNYQLQNFYYQSSGIQNVVWWGAKDRYEGFISFLCYGLTFFIIARFYKPKRLHLLILAGSAVLVSLYGVMQFLGLDVFKIFPFTFVSVTDEYGNPLYGAISAYFRTTLGNIDIVSAYCAFAVVLFAALFAVSKSKSKWNFLYFGASAAAFAIFLIADRDASRVSILGAMVLLLPYWLSDRERLGRLLTVMSGWCAIFAGYSAYVSAMKRKSEVTPFTAPHDQSFLTAYSHKNIPLFIILAVVLLAAGLCLVLFLKQWNEKIMRTAGIIFIAAAFAGGLAFVEIMGSHWSDNPNNIIWQAREMMHGRFGDDFGSGRGWIWKHAVSVLPNHPVLGTGPDTFEYALGVEYQLEAGQLYGVKFDKAHNVFLQIAVCMGIPALLAYLTFLGHLLISAVKKAFERPLLLAFGASALSYIIQSFFCVEVPITTPLVWICLGMVAHEVWMGKIGFDEGVL